MKVFISWSGTTSEHVATSLRDWLPMVIQSLRPFMSQADIPSGQRWEDEIGSQLAATTFGIVCLTPDNLSAPWLLFEAGALSKAIPDSLVRLVPLCHGVRKTDVKPPLGMYQARTTDRTDLLRLVQDINNVMPEPLAETILSVTFDAHWSRLEEKLNAAPKPTEVAMGTCVDSNPARTAEDLLSEVLAAIRDLSRTSRSVGVPTRVRRDQFHNKVHEVMTGEVSLIGAQWPDPLRMEVTVDGALSKDTVNRLRQLVSVGRFDLDVMDMAGNRICMTRDDPPA